MQLDEVSAELRALGTEYKLKRLHELADAIDYRDSLPPVSLDEMLAARIRIYKSKNPDVSMDQIASRFGVAFAFVEATFTAPKPVVKAPKKKISVKKVAAG